MYERQALSEWAKQNSSDFPQIIYPSPAEGNVPSRIEKWRLKTLDTNRWQDLRYKSINYEAIPSLESKEKFFTQAIGVLKRVAIPLLIILNRYERASSTYVIGVDAPFSCIRAFVRAQRRMDVEGSEIKQKTCANEAKEKFESEGVSDAVYRELAMSLFTIRGHSAAPPFVLIHSARDNRQEVIWFRDIFQIKKWKNFYTTLTPLHGDDPAAVPVGSRPTFHHSSWPLPSLPSEVYTPEVFCENPLCSKSFGPPADAELMRLYREHKGPVEREIAQLVEIRMRKIWKERFESELDLALTNKKDGEDDEEIIARYDGLACEEEKKVRVNVINEWRVGLLKCGSCRTGYCSVTCQRQDWVPRHKPFCGWLTPRLGSKTKSSGERIPI
eukprot:TRINITY_DN12316_c0_g1_i1.p1 TRINITY_DN12316_c0_g1~~TRINITY_DN12316_c0_g1_i1.p1  ORF type:complete len:422 (+),score=65.95 TRINITY_DN12316_c0_g1_i1:113-1267(+)